MSPIERRVIDLLRDRGPTVGREIVALIDDTEPGAVRALLLEMLLVRQTLDLTPDLRLTLPPGGYRPQT